MFHRPSLQNSLSFSFPLIKITLVPREDQVEYLTSQKAQRKNASFTKKDFVPLSQDVLQYLQAL